MGVTSKLLGLYRVDQQLTGLKSRLRGAEAYLREQDRQLTEIGAKLESLRSQIRQLEATEHNDENEIKSIEERIARARERMNNAATSKEHSALLTEVNTLKADKSLIEERAIETLTKLDELRAQVGEIETQQAERQKVRHVAEGDRDKKAADIKDRVAELEVEREKKKDDVPASALEVYESARELLGDEVMAAVEEQDRRNKEYACGSCFTHLPVELVSILMKRGDLTRCPSCSVILFMEDELRDSLQSAAEKKKKKREVEA
jgi:predicted  nucleic acid-binding Zn-ribbon protein